MEQSKGKIGLREFVAIVILSIGTKLSDDTPTILVNGVASAAWMAPFIMGAIVILPILLLLKVLSAYESKSLSDVIKHVFGRFFGFILLFILWITSLIAISIDSAIYSKIIFNMYFTKTPIVIIYTLLMVVCAYGAKKGIEHIGSVAWAVIFWVKLSLITALILSLIQGEIHFLFPIFGNGKWELLKESSLKSSIFLDFLYLGLIFPYVKSKTTFKKGTWISLSIIIIEFSLALVGYVMLFDYTGVKLMNFPFHETIRYIEIGFLENIETFFFPFWLVASFVRFTFYLYLTTILFGSLFNIKQFEYLIPTVATLIVSLGMITETPTFTIFKLREQLLNFASPIFIILPFLLWIIAKLKGDLKNEKSSSSSQ